MWVQRLVPSNPVFKLVNNALKTQNKWRKITNEILCGLISSGGSRDLRHWILSNTNNGLITFSCKILQRQAYAQSWRLHCRESAACSCCCQLHRRRESGSDLCWVHCLQRILSNRSTSLRWVQCNSVDSLCCIFDSVQRWQETKWQRTEKKHIGSCRWCRLHLRRRERRNSEPKSSQQNGRCRLQQISGQPKIKKGRRRFRRVYLEHV